MTGLSNKSGATVNKNIIFWLFLLVYTAFIIYWCYTLNIWVDETYSLDTSSYNLRGVISQSYNFEGQPPAYFVFLSWWRLINSAIFFARLFSVVSIGISAWVFYKLVTLISGKDRSLWFVVLFLLNPYTVWASTQARLYAFLLLLSMVSVYFFFKFFIEHKNKYLVIFGITAIIGIYTQYLYVFLLAALGVSVVLLLGWKLFFKYCLYLIPAAVVFLQNILFTTNPMELAYVGSIQSSFISRLISILHSPQNLMLASDSLPFGRVVRLLVTTIFVFLLAYAYLQEYKKNKGIRNTNNAKINIAIISGVSLIFCIAIFFAATGVDYNDRYLTICFPFLVLVLLLLNIYSSVKRKIIFSGIAVYYILLLALLYKHPVNDFDSKALAEYITKIEKQNEPVLFYPKVLALPFKYYYNGKNTIGPLPDSIRFDSTYLSKVKDSVELKQAIEKISTTANSYLLISNRDEPQFANYADIKILNKYLPAHYIITVDTLFYGKLNPLRVRRLEKRKE